MPLKQLTMQPTEAEFEAELHGALMEAFPWLPEGSIQHQTKFSFTFGHKQIDVDGMTVSRAEARSDILLIHDGKPLAVLELKRPSIPLASSDDQQGLSYARMLHPRPPLVVVTNGTEFRLLETRSGELWTPTSAPEVAFATLLSSAAKLSASEIKAAVDTLMGSTPNIWMQAARAATNQAVQELIGDWEDIRRPFVADFLIPRKATTAILGIFRNGLRFALLDGAPLIGKSSVLRELAAQTNQSSDVAVLFVQADEGRGVFEVIADILSESLAWHITAEEARNWLIRVSQGNAAELILAVDGFSPDQTELRRDLEDLSSQRFGPAVKLIVTSDDAIRDRILFKQSGRQQSAIGRRLDAQIQLGVLDDDEFKNAQTALLQHRLVVMHGGNCAPELRIPWILRGLAGPRRPKASEVVGPTSMSVGVLPPLMSFELIERAREQLSEPEVLRLLRALARACLDDANDPSRPTDMAVELTATFLVRRATLRRHIEQAELEYLISSGYIKSIIHASGEPCIVARLPELVASALAEIIAEDLSARSRSDPSTAASWLAEVASKFALGDIIAAQSVFDTAKGIGRIPIALIQELLKSPPIEVPISPGSTAIAYIPGAGPVLMTMHDDGTLIAEANGQARALQNDPLGKPFTYISGFHNWLILSHLAGVRFAVEIDGDQQRVDPTLLIEVGSCKFVLRRPDTDHENPGVTTHEVPNHGEVVCHATGIVEPITLSLFTYLSHELEDAEFWLNLAVERNSLSLLVRIDIVLREISKSSNRTTADWATRVSRDLIKPALRNLPGFLQYDHA